MILFLVALFLKDWKAIPMALIKNIGGLMVHIFIDALLNLEKFMKLIAAITQYIKFFKDLKLNQFNMLVFEKAHNDYRL